MKEDIKDIELLNDELSEFINKPPSWWQKWGYYLLLIIVIIILLLSCLIKYPDKIIASAIITSYNPPVKIYSEVNGFIEKLFIKDSQYVKKNQLIGIIKSPSNYKDVLLLDSILDIDISSDYIIFLNLDLNLGELQSYYADFIKSINSHYNFVKTSFYPQRIKAKEIEYEKFYKYLNNLKIQYEVYKKNYLLAYSKMKRDSTLKINNIISEVEYENSRSNFVEKEYELSKIEVEISLANTNLEKIKQEIIDLKSQYNEKLNNYKLEIEKYKSILKAAIKEWKKKYLLISPINGIASFTNYWNENQYVFKDDLILSIIPAFPESVIGRLKVEPKGIGKVKVGMPVIIKLDNYPYNEYGTLKGYITNISLIPIDNKYILEVKFPDGLKTSYNKNISFVQEMSGIGEIITEKKSLIIRIIEPIKYIFRVQKIYE